MPALRKNIDAAPLPLHGLGQLGDVGRLALVDDQPARVVPEFRRRVMDTFGVLPCDQNRRAFGD
jgi:hypothetical protein